MTFRLLYAFSQTSFLWMIFFLAYDANSHSSFITTKYCTSASYVFSLPTFHILLTENVPRYRNPFMHAWPEIKGVLRFAESPMPHPPSLPQRPLPRRRALLGHSPTLTLGSTRVSHTEQSYTVLHEPCITVIETDVIVEVHVHAPLTMLVGSASTIPYFVLCCQGGTAEGDFITRTVGVCFASRCKLERDSSLSRCCMRHLSRDGAPVCSVSETSAPTTTALYSAKVVINIVRSTSWGRCCKLHLIVLLLWLSQIFMHHSQL